MTEDQREFLEATKEIYHENTKTNAKLNFLLMVFEKAFLFGVVYAVYKLGWFR